MERSFYTVKLAIIHIVFNITVENSAFYTSQIGFTAFNSMATFIIRFVNNSYLRSSFNRDSYFIITKKVDLPMMLVT